MAVVRRAIALARTRARNSDWLRELTLLARGVCFLGRRFECPCCGWRVRGFMNRGGWSVYNHDGYCPRCNAKARHRRLWLFLRDRMNFFGSSHKVLEIGPSLGLSRALVSRRDLDYVTVANDAKTPRLSVLGDSVRLPFADASFDVVICQHVLEHIEDDRSSLAEIRRVLKDDGWAIISAPIRLDQPTYEDPSITDPGERARAFGERSHVRWYGHDFGERLKAAGLESSMDRGDTIDEAVRKRFGLRPDENLFVCRPDVPAK